MECTKCGSEVSEKDNFCAVCGAKLKEMCGYCWVKKKNNYNCGKASCPGYGVFALEKSKP